MGEQTEEVLFACLSWFSVVVILEFVTSCTQIRSNFDRLSVRRGTDSFRQKKTRKKKKQIQDIWGVQNNSTVCRTHPVCVWGGMTCTRGVYIFLYGVPQQRKKHFCRFFKVFSLPRMKQEHKLIFTPNYFIAHFSFSNSSCFFLGVIYYWQA